ncbi:hypothetical protein [Streptomyces sp. NPDC016172]
MTEPPSGSPRGPEHDASRDRALAGGFRPHGTSERISQPAR